MKKNSKVKDILENGLAQNGEISEKEIEKLDLTKPLSLDGLNQSFIDKNGHGVILKDILTDKDWWVLKKGKSQAMIVSHDAVKKIADIAGILTNPKYTILISPSHDNNGMIAIGVEICDDKGRCSVELGEVNKNNLGTRGRANPVNMAQKRGYDRAVFRHLGITGLLGEEELPDEEEQKEMDKLTNDEQKQIVPLINEILNAKTKADLAAFRNKMVKIKDTLNEVQSEYLKGLYLKANGKFVKTF